MAIECCFNLVPLVVFLFVSGTIYVWKISFAVGFPSTSFSVLNFVDLSARFLLYSEYPFLSWTILIYRFLVSGCRCLSVFVIE